MATLAMSDSRGRILSRQQVRFSEAPVRLGTQARCNQAESKVSMRTDPLTGELRAIIVHCGCGEVTVVECNYESENAGSV
jgi:hypothetical protein